MQELITEIAIYLGIAAFLGFLLGYLIWGMGFRRRISAARAEGAAGVRTTVDGDSSLRTQIEKVTRERDRLENRVEVLSARVASLMEGAGDPDRVEKVEEELGTLRLDLKAAEDDPIDAAAAAFSAGNDEAKTEPSIFDDPTDMGGDPANEAVDASEKTNEGVAADRGDSDRSRDDGSEAFLGMRVRRPSGESAEDDATANDTTDASSTLRKPANHGRRLFAAANSLREGLQTGTGGSDRQISEDPMEDDIEPDPASVGIGESELDNDRIETATDHDTDEIAPDEHDTSPGEATINKTGEDQNTTAAGAATEVAATNDDHTPDQDDSADPATDRPGFVLASAPDSPDDLTKIKGIGKSTSKALNNNGVWLFSQLAGMSPQDVTWLRGQLGGQMSRSLEKWVGQARDLSED